MTANLSGLKIPISHPRDIAQTDDNCPMSGINQSRNPNSLADFENEANSTSSVSTESIRRQRDQDFFEKFLRASTNDQQSQIEMDPRELNMAESSSSASQAPYRTSNIDQLLPQANQTSLLASNPYDVSSLYSAFGMPVNLERAENNLLASSLNQSSVSPIYNNINFSTDPNSYNSGGANFLNSLNNQPNTSDNNNLFSGNLSNLSSDYPRNLFDNTRSESTEQGKTYSSVLHSSARGGLNSWQQQQTDGVLSLFDIQHHHCDFLMGRNRQQPIQEQGNINKQRQILNEPTRSFNDLLLGQSNRQDLALRQSTHQSYQQTKQTGPLSAQHRSALTTASSSNSINFQQAGLSRPQELNMSEKTIGNNNNFIVGGASTGQRRRNRSPFFNVRNNLGQGQPGFKLDAHGTGVIDSEESERFSRKVFVGGLPPDIDEEEIKASFRRFGSLIVDWPHKAESKSYFPPKGYAFLLFQEESSVQSLIDSCYQEEDKLYLCVSSPTIKDKPVQIRPWRLSDSDFVLDSTLMLDPRKTVFVGGVPRPLKASELATIINNLYGGVCYVGIDTDPELKYPKGAGRVAFSNHKSYIAAISARFVHIHHSEIEKRVEVKPYVLDDQFCDECQGSRCNNKFAPLFCANITCLRYYCENCWSTVHTQPGKEFHKPLVKECGDRARGGQSFKW